eukprot:Nitzschia sp. Nitz4//scaffold14_size191712//22976//24193//NITZ4_001701-RA/size191712-processed-gene-0.40-mRNA-1//-1//CDS//3329536861//4705//frame0
MTPSIVDDKENVIEWLNQSTGNSPSLSKSSNLWSDEPKFGKVGHVVQAQGPKQPSDQANIKSSKQVAVYIRVRPDSVDGFDILNQESKTESESDDESQRVQYLEQMLTHALKQIAIHSAQKAKDEEMFTQFAKDLSGVRAVMNQVVQERDELRRRLEECDHALSSRKYKEIELHKVIKSQSEDLEYVEKQLSQAEAAVDHLSRKLQQYEQEGKRTPPGSPSDVSVLRKTLLAKHAQVESQGNLIQLLETELENEATVHKLQVDEMIEENLELKQTLKEQAATHAARTKQLQESISRLEDIGKPETMVSLERDQEDLKKILLEMTSKQAELESMLLRRTQQSHEWKRRAMDAEKKLELTEKSESSESTPIEEDGQGDYLQEVINRQTQMKRSGSLWKIFGKGRESP